MSVADWCLSKVGCGYIYGATGWVCTQERLEQQAAQYPEYASTILNTGKKWIGKVCYDCAQLTRNAAKQGGVTFPSGATSQWNKVEWKKKGEIGDLPSDQVCFLYRKSGSSMQHTGVYLGDGTFVHAKGTASGVLHEKLSAYPWTHWGLVEFNQNGSQKEESDVATAETVLYTAIVTGGKLNLRSGPSTSSERIKLIPEGETVEVLEEGTEFARIQWDGNTGWCMKKYLETESEKSSGGSSDNVNEAKALVLQAAGLLGKALELMEQ